MKKKEKNDTFSSRVNPSISKAVKDFCKRTNQKIQGFVESALLRELKAQRNGDQ